MPDGLVIPRMLRAVMTAAADAAWPEEACGLLVSRADRGRLLAAVPVPNRAPAARRRERFEIDSAFHAALARRARAAGFVVCGAFHSHPSGPAALSARDRAGLPGDPDWITLLLGGRDAAGRWHLAAFRGTRPVAIHVTEGDDWPDRDDQLFFRRSSSPVT